jgi:hypothetical protein
MSNGGPYYQLFTAEEQETLKKLETQRIILRRKPLLWIASSSVFISVMAVMGWVIEIEKYSDKAWPFVVILIVVLGFFGTVAWLTFKFPERENLSRRYKRTALRRLAPKVLPGWVFATSHRLMNEDIRKSGLFRDKANRIAREDYLFGPAGKVVAEVYQIALQTETPVASQGKSGMIIQREQPTNYFYGYFYRVHCPVIFPCDVWVFPKQRKLAGEVDDWAELTEEKYSQSNTRKKFVSGDSEFDERFSVYTNDPSLAFAATIMTKTRRDNLLQLDKIFATSCAVSYTTNKVYVMIGYKSDPLDISLRQEIGESLLKQHAEELARMKDVALLVTGM